MDFWVVAAAGGNQFYGQLVFLLTIFFLKKNRHSYFLPRVRDGFRQLGRQLCRSKKENENHYKIGSEDRNIIKPIRTNRWINEPYDSTLMRSCQRSL